MKILTALLALCCALPAFAAEKQDHAAILRTAQNWLEQSLANSPGAASYQIGTIDSRLQLAACKSMQISLPSGYRLLGKSLLQVRCSDGANWAITLPVHISIQLTYYTAARPLPANYELKEGDIAAQQGDLAKLPGSVILNPAQAIGRTLNSPIAAGNPLRQEMLRNPIVIRQKQMVKVVFRDGELEVMNEGTALSNAMEGEPVRVKVTNGQTVSGIARANGTVEVGQ